MRALPDATLGWLLEPADPAVRCRALVELSGSGPASDEVREAREQAMAEGPIAEILAQQGRHGGWEPDGDYYSRGTLAVVPVLAQLGADPQDGRVGRGCDVALSLIPDDGLFSTGCGQPHVLWGLARLGCADDPRFQRAAEALAGRFRVEDGTRAGRLRWQRGICYGKHACFMGVVAALRLFTELSGRATYLWAEALLAESVEFVLRHHLFLSSRNQEPIRHDWTSFAFPKLACDTDVLDLLDAVCGAGVSDDPRLIPAVRLVLGKRTPDGRWRLDHSYSPSDGGRPMRAKTVGNCRFAIRADVGRAGEPSKWVTLAAARALSSVPEELARASAPPMPAQPADLLSSMAPRGRAGDQVRLQAHFEAIGAQPFLAATLQAADTLGLRPHWDWSERLLFLGPDWLPEWMAVKPVIIGGTWQKARESKSGWLWRVMFMARRGALTEPDVLRILRVPAEPPRGKKKRIREGRWGKAFVESSVDLYSIDELVNLTTLLRRALATLSPLDTTSAGGEAPPPVR